MAVRDADRGLAEDSPAERAITREEARPCARGGRRPASAQRDAVLLVCGRGVMAAGIAAAAGVPLGTVKSRLRLGVRRTREALGAAA